jgi:hypothetical protein
MLTIKVLPDPAPAPGGPPQGGVKKVSFGPVATKKKRNSKEYPILENASQQVIDLAEQIRKDNDQFDSLEGSLKSNKAELRRLILPDYFAAMTGSIVTKDDANGLRVATEIKNGVAIGGALLLATSKYALVENDQLLVPLLGQRVGEFFKDTFTISLKSEELPERLDTQTFVNELMGVIAKHGAEAALTIKQGVVATKSFHAQRHQLLTPAQNVTLDAICAFQAQVKTKNIK